jgi:hypothetical protein
MKKPRSAGTGVNAAAVANTALLEPVNSGVRPVYPAISAPELTHRCINILSGSFIESD